MSAKSSQRWDQMYAWRLIRCMHGLSISDVQLQDWGQATLAEGQPRKALGAEI